MSTRQLDKNAAARLRQVRNLTNLARTVFASKYKLSTNSLSAWENGTSPFSEEVAKHLADIFRKEGIKVSSHWIMTGEGPKPKALASRLIQGTDSLGIAISDEEELFWRATSSFKEFYKDCLVLIMHDDTALPFYRPGDHIGGKIITEDKILFIEDEPLIVELENGTIMLRYIEPTSKTGFYNLRAINQATIIVPIIKSMKIKRAARINWVFRR
ncbi:hypothetical protein IM40_07825 [Candidatus Paracaedimonas acanthamoebae]|nr:hypothetical protein IM40_07825 [Candidatus Paracaedimonas acanthamoebae]